MGATDPELHQTTLTNVKLHFWTVAEYRDFVPIVLSDCTIGTSPELHAATLANVDLFIGFVKRSDEAIRMLTSA